LTFLGFALLLTFICAEDEFESQEPEGIEWWIKRPKMIVEKYFFFTTGWLWLISLHWFIATYILPDASTIEEFLAVAVVATIIVLIALVLMEMIGHFLRRAGHRSGSEAVDDIMGAMGLVVGFSWERVYEQSLTVVAIDHSDGNSFAKVLIKTVYGVIFTVCIVPALYLFVTPKAMEENKIAFEEKYGPFRRPDDDNYGFAEDLTTSFKDHHFHPDLEDEEAEDMEDSISDGNGRAGSARTAVMLMPEEEAEEEASTVFRRYCGWL